ncbi:MAG: hypothetical protein ABEJ78_04965 [Haloferacaceae archaeon]
MSLTSEFDHASWRAAAGTLAGYGLLLAAMFVGLFVVPFLLFLAFY